MSAFSDPFLAMVESLRMAPTFARGRRDARAGHVRSLTISSSLVAARVRGPEEPTGFRARVAVRAFGAAEWARVEDDLAGEARYVAELLAGRMPDDIGTVFAAAGLSLLPLSIGDIAMDCSCERWPMPCVHLAATLYALARRFDEDPFGAFAWRGRSRDELLHRLGQLRAADAVAASARRVAGSVGAAGSGPAGPDPAAAAAAASASDAAAASVGSALPDGNLVDPGPGSADVVEQADFWGVEPPPAPPLDVSGGDGFVPFAAAGAPRVLAADSLLDQLDSPAVPAGGRPLVEVLRPAYRALPVDP